MTAILFLIAVTIDLTRQALDRRRDPIGWEIRHAPATGLASSTDADRALDRLAAQATRPRGLNFATPVPTGRC